MDPKEVIAKATEFDARIDGLEARLELTKQFNLKQDDIVGLIKYSAETFALGIHIVSGVQTSMSESIQSLNNHVIVLAKEVQGIQALIRAAQEGGDDPEGGSKVRSGDEWKPPGWTPSFSDTVKDW